MTIRLLSNHELNLGNIPAPEGDIRDWRHFAHTIKGYDVMGGFEVCAELANNGSPSSLTELRCCLFFLARKERHNGGWWDATDEARVLLRQIRALVAAGELD